MADPFQSVTVVNRRRIKWEGMFSGVCIVFGPLERKSYPPNVAFAVVSDSALRTNLASGIKEVFALGIEGDEAYPTDPLDGDLAVKNPVEQLDRRDVPRLTETEPKVLGQGGTQDLGIGKVEKTVTPVPGTPQESPYDDEPASGGDVLGGGVPAASSEEVKSISFKNPDVQRGSQRPGRAEHRVNVKPAN